MFKSIFTECVKQADLSKNSWQAKKKNEKLGNHEKPNFGGKEGVSNFHIFSLLFLHASIKVEGGGCYP